MIRFISRNKQEVQIMEERKIGEIFEFGGEWYQCVNYGFSCADCDINGDCSDACVGSCSSCLRKDGKQVRFKKLEKVGEPHFIEDEIFEGGKVYVQNFKVYKDFEGHNPICNDYIIYDWKNRIISIEIKQKEDMEEKKQCGDTRFRTIARAKEHLFQATNIAEDKKELEVLDSFLLRCWQMGWLKQYEDVEEKKTNLSPFDIQKAREGKPVCTRDGRKARIICFDLKNEEYPIVAAIGNDSSETLLCYTINGEIVKGSYKSDKDLMMLPEKKEGWVNVYNHLGVITLSHNPFDTKEEALEELKSASGRAYCVDTIKINWEE